MSEVTVKDEKELGEALKNGADYIIVEGDLANKVIRIKASGNVAWVIAIGAIAVVAVAMIASIPTGGTSGVVGVAALAPAVAVLGSGPAMAAVLIAVAGGGVGVLNSLRGYSLEKISAGRVILRK
ncbi:MAG: hypothetical protein LBR53_08535 [Deltaproteobacteria bacterium]|nr:hypothetical protein [Deltaproteobacteria bacterium]